MADFDPNDVVRVPGQLFAGVTNLSAADYGGTAVGYFENGRAIVAQEIEDIESEATGQRVGALLAPTLIGVRFELVQYDTDMLAFPWGGSGTSQREPRLGSISAPGYQTARGPLLFAARDPEHPSLLFFAPMYFLESQGISFGSMGEKRRDLISVRCVEDANGHVYQCDLLRNLSLT